jgi:hypothetical protein
MQGIGIQMLHTDLIEGGSMMLDIYPRIRTEMGSGEESGPEEN